MQSDIANLKAALAGKQYEDVFMPATTPRSMGRNEHYRSEDEYLHAVADALNQEYRAIVDAGFLVQLDDQSLVTAYHSNPSLTMEDSRKRAEERVELLNYSLRGIPMDKVRLIQSDTAVVPRGSGTMGSRSLQIAGSAVHNASIEVLEKARVLAAHLLEANVDDIVIHDGGLGVAGVPANTISWQELAISAMEEEKRPPGWEGHLAHELDPWVPGRCFGPTA